MLSPPLQNTVEVPLGKTLNFPFFVVLQGAQLCAAGNILQMARQILLRLPYPNSGLEAHTTYIIGLFLPTRFTSSWILYCTALKASDDSLWLPQKDGELLGYQLLADAIN